MGDLLDRRMEYELEIAKLEDRIYACRMFMNCNADRINDITPYEKRLNNLRRRLFYYYRLVLSQK